MAVDLRTDLNFTDYSSYLDTVALSVVVITQRTDKFISNYRNSINDVCKFCVLIS